MNKYYVLIVTLRPLADRLILQYTVYIIRNPCLRLMYPGSPVQCGPITDVGISLDKMDGNITKSGSLPQHMTSCLDVLDYFLNQNRPVVSSLIPIERSVEIKTDHGEYTNTVEAFVAHVLGM